MDKCSTKSRSKRASVAQQMPNAPRPGPIAIAILSHEDIARRAYDIYIEKGCRQGQGEENWLQAEQELKSRQNWLQDGWETKNRDPAGESCGPLNDTGGGRSCSVCSTIRSPAVASASKKPWPS
jgi:hypothetical protein